MGLEHVITFDMGGTTATKASLIERGEVTAYMVKSAAAPLWAHVTSRRRGLHAESPAVDLAEVRAGGGSIIWTDAGGSMRVGPPAPSIAGPGLHDLGGEQATISDANLVIGYLNPDYLVGGACLSTPRRRGARSRRWPCSWALISTMRPTARTRSRPPT